MGKTVTTYLVDGDPKGTRYAFIGNKICQMFMVPRANLTYLNKQTKLHKPAFYILLGENEDGEQEAYIGETENFRERVKDHDYKKEFWQKALIFVSKDADLTKADVQYLEYRGIALAKATKNYKLEENKQIPKIPNLPEWRMDDMDQFFEDIRFLADFAGCNIFEEVTHTAHEHVFYISGKKFNASGIYTSDGFVVLKGSVVAADNTQSYKWPEKRKKLLDECTESTDGKLVTVSDKLFNSPSAAAEFCNGSMTNGWTAWKDKDHNTLAQVYNHQLE